MPEISKLLPTDEADPVATMCEQVLPQTFPIFQAVGVRHHNEPDKTGLVIVINKPGVERLLAALKKAGEDTMARSIEISQSRSFAAPREVM